MYKNVDEMNLHNKKDITVTRQMFNINEVVIMFTTVTVHSCNVRMKCKVGKLL